MTVNNYCDTIYFKTEEIINQELNIKLYEMSKIITKNVTLFEYSPVENIMKHYLTINPVNSIFKIKSINISNTRDIVVCTKSYRLFYFYFKN